MIETLCPNCGTPVPITATVLDYVPGYRTPAGTGAGMAFARWLLPADPLTR